MKTAKELIIPFSFENRRAAFLDENFLYVPSQIEHVETRLLFKNVKIEFCSGNGQWIVEKAKRFPNFLWVAVEKKFDRAKKIWLRAKQNALSNVFIACSDASTFVNFYSPLSDEFFINFPDPWPKRKHKKHRLVQENFLKELLNVALDEAVITCATDHEIYASQMLEEFQACKGWELLSFQNEMEGYGNSFFQDLWLSKGKTIHYLSHKRAL